MAYIVVGPHVVWEDPRVVWGPIAGFMDKGQAEQFRSSWSRCMRGMDEAVIVPSVILSSMNEVIMEESLVAIYASADEAAMVEGARIGHYRVNPIRLEEEIELRS